MFRVMEDGLASFGIRIRHYSVLETLFGKGPMAQQELATCLRIDAATMVATIDDLERLELVVRKRGIRDRRRSVVSILPEGENMLGRINAFLDNFDDEYLADITVAQRNELHRLVRKLADGGKLIRAFDEVRGK